MTIIKRRQHTKAPLNSWKNSQQNPPTVENVCFRYDLLVAALFYIYTLFGLVFSSFFAYQALGIGMPCNVK